MSPIRIATRGSELALAQSGALAERIGAVLGEPTELIVVRTTGDRIQDRSLAKIGGKGLFVKEIEEALVDGRADLAVHSAKDVPARIAPGCTLAAFPERADPRDALCARVRGTRFDDLPPGARVGTGSTRRRALLLRARPDLEVVALRGNVPTRLAKLADDGLDAVVLAAAGLDRLGLSDRIDERLDPALLLPAIGQGLLALETREDDPLRERLVMLETVETRAVALAERGFQVRLGGDCSVPLAAFAEPSEDGGLHLRGLVSSLDGRNLVEAEGAGPAAAAEAIGRAVAETLLSKGGDVILQALREEGDQGG